MNKIQKIILSIVVTLILFILAYLWSTSNERCIFYKEHFDSITGYQLDIPELKTRYVNIEFYELQYNWHVWILCLIVSGGFNFWIFSDRKQDKKDKKE